MEPEYPTHEVTKLEVASSQLNTAIELYFTSRDVISTHALTSSAYDLIRGMIKGIGLESATPEFEYFPVSLLARNHLMRALGAAHDFFKHTDIDVDPKSRFAYSPDATEYLLYAACQDHALLDPVATKLKKVFVAWHCAWHAVAHEGYKGQTSYLKIAEISKKFTRSQRGLYYFAYSPKLDSVIVRIPPDKLLTLFGIE